MAGFVHARRGEDGEASIPLVYTLAPKYLNRDCFKFKLSLWQFFLLFGYMDPWGRSLGSYLTHTVPDAQDGTGAPTFWPYLKLNPRKPNTPELRNAAWISYFTPNTLRYFCMFEGIALSGTLNPKP